ELEAAEPDRNHIRCFESPEQPVRRLDVVGRQADLLERRLDTLTLPCRQRKSGELGKDGILAHRISFTRPVAHCGACRTVTVIAPAGRPCAWSPPCRGCRNARTRWCRSGKRRPRRRSAAPASARRR